jgi:hypothetical protein
MIKSGRFFKFSGFAYSIGAICLGAAVVFQIVAIHGASSLALNSLSWFAMGFLANCVGQAFNNHNSLAGKV